MTRLIMAEIPLLIHGIWLPVPGAMGQAAALACAAAEMDSSTDFSYETSIVQNRSSRRPLK